MGQQPGTIAGCSTEEDECIKTLAQVSLVFTNTNTCGAASTRIAQKNKLISAWQVQQRMRSRFNAFLELLYGGIKAIKRFFYKGETPIVSHLPSEKDPSIHNARPLPAYKPRRLNSAHKARRKFRYFSNKKESGLRSMPNKHADWNLNNCDILRRIAIKLTDLQRQKQIEEEVPGALIRRVLEND